MEGTCINIFHISGSIISYLKVWFKIWVNVTRVCGVHWNTISYNPFLCVYIYILYITKSRYINKCSLNLKTVKENKSFTIAIMSVCNLSLKNHIIWKTCTKKTWKIQNIKEKVQCSILNKIQPREKRQSFSYHKGMIKNSCTLDLPSVLYSISLKEMTFFLSLFQRWTLRSFKFFSQMVKYCRTLILSLLTNVVNIPTTCCCLVQSSCIQVGMGEGWRVTSWNGIIIWCVLRTSDL